MVQLTQASLLIAILALGGCGKQGPEVKENKFDPRIIADEADKGNLEPLKELNAACSAEVKSSGKRMSACNAQDEVRKLSKPIIIEF